MKTLEFDARGQSLRVGKYSKPKAGSTGGYLRAKFTLDGEYDDAEVIAVSFGDGAGDNEIAVELDGTNECPFPDGVTGFSVISVWLTCRTVGGSTFQTNRAKVQQRS